jgi:hypothetical protein
MTLRMNERCPIHDACRWEQLWRQREFASPVREGINQIRACRFWRGIPEPSSQETRVPISPTSVGAELLRFAVPPTIERAFGYRRTCASCSSGIWLLVVNLASATAGTTCPRTQIFGLGFFTIQWSPRSCLKPSIPPCTGSSRRELKDRPLGDILKRGAIFPTCHCLLLLDRRDRRAYISQRDQTMILFALVEPKQEDDHNVLVDALLMSPGTENYKLPPGPRAPNRVPPVLG